MLKTKEVGVIGLKDRISKILNIAMLEGTTDSKAISQLFKIVQGRENHSINLLSDAPVDGTEGTVGRLTDVHFPGSTALVQEGECLLWGLRCCLP